MSGHAAGDEEVANSVPNYPATHSVRLRSGWSAGHGRCAAPRRLVASGTESLPPSQSLRSIPSLSIAASCLVRFQLLPLRAERDSRQEPPLTSTTSVAWPEPGEFESQTGLARHESSPSGPARPAPRIVRSGLSSLPRGPVEDHVDTSGCLRWGHTHQKAAISGDVILSTDPRIHGCYEGDRRLKQRARRVQFKGTWLSDWPRRPSACRRPQDRGVRCRPVSSAASFHPSWTPAV